MSRFSPGFLHTANGNDQYTKILLHMDGSNGGTTFTDSNLGGSAHTWSAASATTSTSAPKFGTASMLAATGYISTPDSTDFTLGSSDWTVDFWLKTSTTTGQALFGQGNGGTTSSITMTMNSSAVTGIIYTGTTGTSISSATNLTDGSWHHVALVRSGGSIMLFLDGVLKTTIAYASAISNVSDVFAVGQVGALGGATSFNGNIDEFRLSVGIARWTADFTPPTSAYS